MTDVRIYIQNADGTLESDRIVPMTEFGVCPNVGDTLIIEKASITGFYSVQRRYYVDLPSSAVGWAVVLREIESSRAMDAVLTAWRDDDAFWAAADARFAMLESKDEQAKTDGLLKKISGNRSPKKRGRSKRRENPKGKPE